LARGIYDFILDKSLTFSFDFSQLSFVLKICFKFYGHFFPLSYPSYSCRFWNPTTVVLLSSASSLCFEVKKKERRTVGRERKVRQERKEGRKKDAGEVFYWIYSEQDKT